MVIPPVLVSAPTSGKRGREDGTAENTMGGDRGENANYITLRVIKFLQKTPLKCIMKVSAIITHERGVQFEPAFI